MPTIDLATPLQATMGWAVSTTGQLIAPILGPLGLIVAIGIVIWGIKRLTA